jgi:hypothetical protein
VTNRSPPTSSNPLAASNVCENVVCGEGATCEPLTGECRCPAGSDGGDPNDLVRGCNRHKERAMGLLNTFLIFGELNHV